VKLQVKSSARVGQGVVLNSEAVLSDPANVEVTLSDDAVAKLARQGIPEPQQHFLNKTLRVRGRLEEYLDRDRVRRFKIVVSDPAQIQVIEPEP
jgi:hypothetical protein